MTTLVPFVVPPNSTFQSLITLDGQPYTLSVKWNVSGQRWYMFLSDQRGNPVLNQALIGSPDTSDIDLVQGYFSSTLIFRTTTQIFEITP